MTTYAPPYVTDFPGVDPTGQTDSTQGLLAALSCIASQPYKATLAWPPGQYVFCQTLPFGIANSAFEALGEVHLHYTGAGNAISFDGGAATGGIYNMQFGVGNRFIIEAPNTQTDVIFARAVLQGCKIGVQVNSGCPTAAGMRVEFGVCVDFDYVCSNNVAGGFPAGATPGTGVVLTQRNAGELTSYCTFHTPIIEGVGSIGADLDCAQGNTFDKGTIEGCGSVGMYLRANAKKNAAVRTDFEVNGNHDVYCLGTGNLFDNINSDVQATFDGTASNNNVIGGTYQNLLLTSNTFANLLDGCTYNQSSTSGTLSDTGRNRHRNVRNAKQSNIMDGAMQASGASAGTSPFSYQNQTFDTQFVSVIGGTSVQITLTHAGVVLGNYGSPCVIPLAPGDLIGVSFVSGQNFAPPIVVVMTM